MSITVNPLKPFGAELDVDVRDPRNAEALCDLFQQYGLLVFRNQSLKLEEHVNLMSLFGYVVTDYSGVGFVSNVRPDGILGNDELAFHTDLGQCPIPFYALSLHALDVENNATSTLYSSGERAYVMMPAELRDRLRRRQVQNLWSSEEETRKGRTRNGKEPGIEAPGAVHDVFVKDPITGRHTVAALPMYSERILGVSREESDRLLNELFAVQYAPDNIYEHRWHVGDLVIWSNRVFPHSRSALRSTKPRTLQRVCIGTQHIRPGDYKPPENYDSGYR